LDHGPDADVVLSIAVILLHQKKCLNHYEIKPSSEKKWPTLPETFLIKKNDSNDALQSWNYVIGLLQKFRQGPSVGRNSGKSKRPGRSRWPEPETLRRITGQRFARHPRTKTIPDDAFPRAEFGLPIIFHFKDESDPKESIELHPIKDGEEKSRMASPLILKALKCSNDEILQLILRLNTPSIENVHLKKVAQNTDKLAIKDGYPARSAKGSALEAFISFAKEKNNNYEEISG